uniref:Uncharacterized protein n=1 Tax=Rhizophora mucronata TaxID=61149 RepID=A0A2P2PQP5_RHIMU
MLSCFCNHIIQGPDYSVIKISRGNLEGIVGTIIEGPGSTNS